jgi:hypothetical protein
MMLCGSLTGKVKMKPMVQLVDTIALSPSQERFFDMLASGMPAVSDCREFDSIRPIGGAIGNASDEISTESTCLIDHVKPMSNLMVLQALA